MSIPGKDVSTNIWGVSCVGYKDILPKFLLSHNFESGLRTLKPENVKTFNLSLKNVVFFSPDM